MSPLEFNEDETNVTHLSHLDLSSNPGCFSDQLAQPTCITEPWVLSTLICKVWVATSPATWSWED